MFVFSFCIFHCRRRHRHILPLLKLFVVVVFAVCAVLALTKVFAVTVAAAAVVAVTAVVTEACGA